MPVPTVVGVLSIAFAYVSGREIRKLAGPPKAKNVKQKSSVNRGTTHLFKIWVRQHIRSEKPPEMASREDIVIRYIEEYKNKRPRPGPFRQALLRERFLL